MPRSALNPGPSALKSASLTIGLQRDSILPVLQCNACCSVKFALHASITPDRYTGGLSLIYIELPNHPWTETKCHFSNETTFSYADVLLFIAFRIDLCCSFVNFARMDAIWTAS